VQLAEKIKAFFSLMSESGKAQLTDKLQFELKELENVFALLVIGQMSGIPLPPSFLTLELLPLLEKELIIMLGSAHDAQDMLGRMAGMFDCC